MAAPRNDEERERIYRSATKLFLEQGFNKTSYASIAEACGTSKSMVQHYFPKKELFIETFFARHIEQLSETAQALAENPDDVLEVFCLMGLLHFSKLLGDGELHVLAKDIVASRALTDGVVNAERTWAAQRLPRQKGVVNAADALTVSLGGAYELVYQYQKTGAPITPSYIERAAIVPFALTMGYTRSEAESTLVKCEREVEPALSPSNSC